MKSIHLLFIFTTSLVLSGCVFKLEQKNTQSNCGMKPETGQCRAAIKKYFFDQASLTCQEFTWGGCGGSVPFETLEDCQYSCEQL